MPLMCAWVISFCILSTKSPDTFVSPATIVCLIKAALDPLAKNKSFPYTMTIIQYPPWKLSDKWQVKTNFH